MKSGMALLLFALEAASEQAGVAQDVEFVAECDHTPQRYVLVPPAAFAPDKMADVLIALHGHGSDRWQFVKDPRDECRAARDVATAHGMLYVSPDYRATTSWMGPKAEADLVQIIRDIKRQYHVGKVVLCGGSMGGAACLTFAVLHPDLTDGVASMNGLANHLEYAQFQDAIQESFGGTKSEIPEEYKKRSAEFWPEKLTMPIAFTVSGKDDAVPPDSVLRLAEKLKGLGRDVLLIHRPEQGHLTTYDDAKAIIDYVLREAHVIAAGGNS